MRTGTELGVLQGHLLFPLSVLEPYEEDGQPTNVPCVNVLFWVQLCPPLGATLRPWLLPAKTASDETTGPACSLCLQKAVFEDVPLGTVILRVKATDADSGRFALIQYSLGDGEGKFGINPNTVRIGFQPTEAGTERGKGGEAEIGPPRALLPHLTFCPFSSTSSARRGPPEGLCVLQGDIYILSALDREKKDHYTLTAVARDNPGDVSSNRRENSVQVGLSSSHHPSRGGHQQEGVKPQAFLPSELAGGSRRN